jgi:hypothetical protein
MRRNALNHNITHIAGRSEGGQGAPLDDSSRQGAARRVFAIRKEYVGQIGLAGAVQ